MTGYNAVDSGIGQHFADLAIGLRELGHSVIAVTPLPPANLHREPQLAGVEFAPFDARMPRWLDRLSGFRWQLNSLAGLRHRVIAARQAVVAATMRRKIDVFESTSSGALAADYLRHRTRVPVATRVSTTATQLVAHNSGQASWPDRVEQRWEEQVVRRSDRLLTHTLHHRDELCRAWNLPPEAFTIIPHGIRLPLRSELPASHQEQVIDVLYVGRFEHRKGIDVLLDCIPTLLAADPRVRFTLVGQDAGDYWQQLFWATNPMIERARVTFAGILPSDKLQACYRACTFLVAPSRYESFGLIYVEAMAWAKPVIGCRAGGVPEVVVDGVTGLLASPGDRASLQSSLLRLVQSPALRAQLGLAARQHVEANFSRATLAARSAAFYQDVAAVK